MPKAGQGEFERAGRASCPRLSFENLYFQSVLSENDRRRKAIGTGADNASSKGHVRFSVEREFMST